MSAPLTLAIDAATYTGTVAIIAGDVLLAECEVAMRGETEERLMPAVAEVLSTAGAAVGDIQRVACGAGPGSFTSLRIAASIAKGIAAGRDVPLFAVPSLLLVLAGSQAASVPGRYLAVLDALRGDVYVAGYEVIEAESGATAEIVEMAPAPTALVPRDDLDALARSLGATPLGPREATPAWPRASGFSRLRTWLERDGPVDLASWEPSYGRLAEAQVRWEREHGRPLTRH
ncbi:MAG TPA: tRNA (adenosine(37)-N6)-threonylcarbamoyltransferase complex dimerization subunit type 1 TsaB [Gemmatimonadaceae bacterium]|jgi:universal bacterial protein YeaZ